MRWLSLSLVATVLTPTVAFVNGNDDWHMSDWRHMMWSGCGGGFMWIVFFILIGVVVYFVLRNAKSSAPQNTRRETPMEVLKRRYAKGEITKEQFDEMKRDLED